MEEVKKIRTVCRSCHGGCYFVDTSWGQIFILDFRLVSGTSDIQPAHKTLVFLS